MASDGYFRLRWQKSSFWKKSMIGTSAKHAAESFEDGINLTNKEEEEAKTAATAKFNVSNPWKRRHVQLLTNS